MRCFHWHLTVASSHSFAFTPLDSLSLSLTHAHTLTHTLWVTLSVTDCFKSGLNITYTTSPSSSLCKVNNFFYLGGK
ncbi:hypothetical protein VNO77_43228 [Canavalia gladiata]|uniref:Uncharacterized protein n=1 Tax=Canavalia gladiata TaxID=3824 RepID=A0AAN9JVY6_CANGL